jgi:hypothetical protein
MEVVYQDQNLSMGWCLECHRAPEKHLRPLEEVFNLKFDAEEYLANSDKPEFEGLETQEDLGLKLKDMWRIQPRESCATCHH